MTANENNRRYLAEAWIEEDKDEEFKKSFLENLLNQLEHHKADGSGFDADMLDGKHYCEISKEIDEKVKGFLNDFSIGKVHISNENGSEYTLGFDSITLFANVDGYNSEEKTLPWDDSPRETSTTLLEVFRELYEKIVTKAEQTQVNEIESRVDSLEDLDSKISSAITDDGNGGYNLNAQTINGVQIYILSETAYAGIPQSEKNNIKNIYIVKPDDEIDTDIYTDGIVTDNTNIAEISRFYEFRVIEKTNEETQSPEKWLQYRHQGISPEREEGETEEQWKERDDATWNDMTKTSDFLDNSLIQSIVMNYLSSGSYNLSPTAVKAAFQQIGESGKVGGFTKFDTSPPIQFLLENFLSGVKYDEDDPNEPIVHTLPNQGNSQYLDIDLLIEDIEDIIDAKLNSYKDSIYPVGSIYMNIENVNPASLFGGTWEKIKGKFLLAATEGNQSTYPLGSMGGTATHRLETNELPSHYHTHSHKHKSSSKYLTSNDNIKVNIEAARKWPEQKTGGTHFVYATPGTGTTKLTGIVSVAQTGDPTSNNTSNTGGSQPHNNMPPYVAVNIWRRTA